MTFGDGVDNDCDGSIDEELCTGTNLNADTDGDGRVDEDCAINRDISQGGWSLLQKATVEPEMLAFCSNSSRNYTAIYR